MSGSETDKGLPRGVADAIKEAEWLRGHVAAGKTLRVWQEHIVDLDDYAHTLQSRLSAAQGEITKWRDLANLWADVACNGLQYLKNTADGISTASTAISDLGREIQSVRALSPPSQQEQKS